MPVDGDTFNSLLVVDKSHLAEHVSQNFQQSQVRSQKICQRSTCSSNPAEEYNASLNQQ